jgi:hypothetical protein
MVTVGIACAPWPLSHVREKACPAVRREAPSSLALGATGSESDRSSESQLYFCRNAMETGPGGRSRQIENPDGNWIELFEPARYGEVTTA